MTFTVRDVALADVRDSSAQRPWLVCAEKHMSALVALNAVTHEVVCPLEARVLPL